jgi:hypothetical protein
VRSFSSHHLAELITKSVFVNELPSLNREQRAPVTRSPEPFPIGRHQRLVDVRREAWPAADTANRKDPRDVRLPHGGKVPGAPDHTAVIPLKTSKLS